MSSKKNRNAAKKDAKKERRMSSPLSAHQRQGQRVVPPMLALPALTLTSWAKDALPDFLWVCSLLTEDSLDGMHAVVDSLDVVQGVLAGHNLDLLCVGPLTQFEQVPKEIRAEVIEALVASEQYERAFPEGFAHALGMYPDAPGSWLIDPWRARGLTIDPEKAQQYLAPVIAESYHGQSLVATRAKYLWIGGMAKAGKLHLPRESDLPDLLSRYPLHITEEERRYTEPSIRATFGAFLAMQDGKDATCADWCRAFWRANWKLFACIPPEAPTTSAKPPSREVIQETLQALESDSDAIRARFESTALRVDPDLYEPDRYEVLTGIAARAIRLVEGAIASPLLWTDEYGSAVMRSIVEAKIVIRWLALKNDPTLFEQFKNYGRGKLKLLKLHAEEYLDSLDDPPDTLVEYVEHLNAEVNAEIMEEFQEINIGSSFAGVTTRQMAIDTGLKRDYDFVFAPTSGTTHGDWTALDRYALARCRNPLHRWHRIPNFEPAVLVDPSQMDMVLGWTDEVVGAYVDAVDAQPESTEEGSDTSMS